MKVAKLVPVIVEWEDACARGGWDSKESYESHETAKVSTVGFLLKKTKTKLTLISSHANEDGDMMQGLSIPMGWVKKIRRLR